MLPPGQLGPGGAKPCSCTAHRRAQPFLRRRGCQVQSSTSRPLRAVLAARPCPGAWPLAPHMGCLRFLTDLPAPCSPVQAASSQDLRYPGKMVVFHVPTWNLPGLNLLGKASLACAQTMPGEDMLPLCSAVWVATLARTKHFTFWKQRLQSSARWKAHWCL